MKTLLLTLLLIIPSLTFSQVITDGLVGYWPFNGNANDESGNGNHGTVNGATLTEDRFGNANSAYSFNGNHLIELGDNSNLSISGNLSISVWIKTTSINSHVLGAYQYPSPYIGYGLAIGIGQSTGGELSFWNSNNWIQSNSEINEGTWKHLVIVWENDTRIRFFIDNTLDRSLSSNESLSSYDGIKYIGARADGGKRFTGVIDDLMIFDKALTEIEIEQLFYDGTNSQPSPQLCQSIYCDGENIGIGTSETHNHKLAVAGSILTEEIKVKIQENWPDYVFEEDYPLADLKELEEYIIKNKHLPEIPDAKAIKEEGYYLSELDAKLLEKIEELTLYIIEQEKEIESQKERIEALERQNKLLELIELRLKKLERN